MYSLALCSLISGFDNIGVVAFQKDLELHKEFYFGVAKKLATFVVTIALAFLWRDYWALIVGMIVGRAVSLVLSYWVHPYRPRFSLAAAGELYHFSKWMLANNILIYINNSGINTFIGKVFGPDALGVYSVAYEISNLPTTELVWPISRAVFPGYSMLAGDIGELRKSFLQVISVVALLTVPAGVGIGLVADPLVRVLLGEKWLAAVGLIQVLAAFGIVRTFLGPPGSIYVALGKPQLVAYLQALHITVAVLLLFCFMGTYGVISVPWAILIASAVSMPTSYCWLLRLLKLPPMHLVEVIWRPLAAALLMCLPVMWLQHGWAPSSGLGQNILRLALCTLLGGVTYTTAIVLFWHLARRPDGAETKVIGLLRDRIFARTGREKM
jgi:O-antigen/teichoic acid export membrane protein